MSVNEHTPSVFDTAKRTLALFGVWVVAGILFAAQSYYYRTSLGADAAWWDLLGYDGSYFVLWAFFSPLVVRLARRFPLERPRLIRHILVHAALGLCVGILHRAVFDILFMPLRATPERPFTFARYYFSVVGSFDYSVLVYCIILFVTHAGHYYRRLQSEQVRVAALRGELASAQLQVLKMQLHPHFLFNTLNALSVLIRQNPRTADAMLGELSDLLRATLEQGNQHEITLRRELGLLAKYLSIQQIRFGERLSTDMHIDDGALEACLPTFVLQPIVENAIQYGIASTPEAGCVRIGAHRVDGMLEVTVFNSGPGLRDTKNAGNGLGLSNTRARLQTLYGERQSLTIADAPGGVVATLRTPFRTEAVTT